MVLNTSYWIGVLIMVLYKVVGSVSLRTISLSGTLTFAHGAFIALGAYCGGILAKSFALPPVVTILAGGLFAMVVSVITGLPFVRLKGMYYSMASMFMGVTVAYIIKAMKITRRLSRPDPDSQAAPERYCLLLCISGNYGGAAGGAVSI